MNMSYKIWNDAIGRYFFGPQHAEQRVFLAVDDDILWKIIQGDGSGLQFASCEHAVQAFVTAVRDELCRYGEWAFTQPREDEYPLFLGLLAIQVLAVFKMREDKTWGPNAYWGRLGELLGDTISRRPFSLDENRQHQILWRQGVAHWANEIQQGRWGTVSLPPETRQGEKRCNHVGLPKSQALLTSADLALLHHFYQEADLQPGEDVDEAFLLEKIQKCLTKPALLRPHAQRVLSDPERNLLACGQIRDHLRRGDCGDPIGDESLGKARLWLEIKESVPLELDGGLIVAEKVLLEIQLQEVLGKTKYSYAPRKIFRPIHSHYYVTILDTFDNRWEERRYAKPGEEVLLLMPQREVSQRYQTVRHVAANNDVLLYHADDGRSPAEQTTVKLRGLPQGWCVMRFHVCAEFSVPVPSWCSSWIYAPPLQLIGGLRLARQTWMTGAGPTVLVQASDVTAVYIDGCPYAVVDHRVTPQQAFCLEQPGRHTVQIENSPCLQFSIEHRDTLPERSIAGWIFQGQQWPSREWQVGCSDSFSRPAIRLQGPVVSGEGKREPGVDIPIQRQWLELAMRMRDGQTSDQASSRRQAEKTPHSLIRQMQQIVEPGLPWFRKRTKG